MFPSDKYYTLDDHNNGIKTIKKTIKKTVTQPKKKRSSVHINEIITKKKEIKTSEEETDEEPDEVVEEEPTEKETLDKERKKSNPLTFNRNAKSLIDFIIGRFLWEIFYIEPDGEDYCPETKSEIEEYILNAIENDWSRTCNVTQLIIHSVKSFQPSKIITNSYGLDKELRTEFDKHITNTSFASFAAGYTMEFMKLLSLFFSNRSWLEKSQTINIKIFETVLRYIEMSIPVSCKTVSKGLMAEIFQYDAIVNPIKTKESKTDKSKQSKTYKVKEAKTDKVKEVKESKMSKAKTDKVKEAKTDKVKEVKEAKTKEAKTDKAKTKAKEAKTKEAKTKAKEAKTKEVKAKTKEAKTDKAKAKTKTDKESQDDESNDEETQYDESNDEEMQYESD
jgi:hypothetical protein